MIASVPGLSILFTWISLPSFSCRRRENLDEIGGNHYKTSFWKLYDQWRTSVRY